MHISTIYNYMIFRTGHFEVIGPVVYNFLVFPEELDNYWNIEGFMLIIFALLRDRLMAFQKFV